MRSYSSAVMLCWASNCGVTATGSGTTAEEAVVITVASIVARDSRAVRWANVESRAIANADCGRTRSRCGRRSRLMTMRLRGAGAVGADAKAVRYFESASPRPGWRNWQTQRTQNRLIQKSNPL